METRQSENDLAKNRYCTVPLLSWGPVRNGLAENRYYCIPTIVEPRQSEMFLRKRGTVSLLSSSPVGQKCFGRKRHSVPLLSWSPVSQKLFGQKEVVYRCYHGVPSVRNDLTEKRYRAVSLLSWSPSVRKCQKSRAQKLLRDRSPMQFSPCACSPTIFLFPNGIGSEPNLIVNRTACIRCA